MRKQKPYNPHQNKLFRPLMLIIPLVALPLALMIAVAILADIDGGYQKPLLQGHGTELSEGWEDSAGNIITLPAKLPYREDGYSFSLKLDTNYAESQHLLFSTKYLNARIFLDGEQLGTSLCRPSGEGKTLGKAFVLLPLPQNISGRTLRIVAEPLIGEDTKYEIVAPHIGTSALLIYEIIWHELPLLLIISAIFCFGVFLLICGVQAICVPVPQNDLRLYHTNFLQVGLFAILFSLYSLVITDSIYLFASNYYYIYLMEFLLLALLPLPLLLQVVEVCEPKVSKILLVDCFILCLNACLQAYVHFAAGVELRNIVFITHIIMVVSVILLIPALIFGSRKDKGRWWLPLSFSPILVGAILDIVRYYLPGAYQKAIDFQLGVLLFLLLQTVYLIHINLVYYENHLKSNVYRQLAYTDALTGLANRTAFEEKLVEIRGNQGDYSAIWCISADVNNLKQTNDTLGHAMGDSLIKAAAHCLQAAALTLCDVYRTGGDEFVLFIFNQSEQDIEALKTRFNAAVNDYNLANHEPILSVALGCDRFSFTRDGTIDKLLSRADSLMYENKRAWKKPAEPAYL